ncbi:hypothetical protein [Halomonas elongata]|uniref:hypothetical protein n=1 Tax=Halomonas elongata TaxID=2746 RepID=UPI00186B6A71|nr:hypothetical protein [Halomonas elongata]MBW5800089.1 hypothetical protein [Halomonas elongata]
MAETEEGRLKYRETWQELRDEAANRHEAFVNDAVRKGPMRAALTEAFRDFLLACYSESIRLEMGTAWEPLEGLDGARLIAREKLSLLPSETDQMGAQALARILHRELHGFTLPQEAFDACHSDLCDRSLYLMLKPHGLGAATT